MSRCAAPAPDPAHVCRGPLALWTEHSGSSCGAKRDLEEGETRLAQSHPCSRNRKFRIGFECATSSRTHVAPLSPSFLLQSWERLRVWGPGSPPTPGHGHPRGQPQPQRRSSGRPICGALRGNGQRETYCLCVGTTFMLVTWISWHFLVSESPHLHNKIWLLVL